MANQNNNEAVPVCVTGANGFIGSWLVQTLLDNPRYTIHATIFPGTDPSDLFTLHPDAKARLTIDVVAILPATCLGRLLQPSLNSSCTVLQRLMMGSRDTQEYHWLGAVHVKDVAKAQVLLYETPTAAGRYLCTNGIYQFSRFANTASELYPDFPIHRFPAETQPGLTPCKDAARRLIDLGLVFTPVQDAVREAAESLIAKGFLQRTPSRN